MRLIFKAFYLISTLLTLTIIVLPFLALSNSPSIVYEKKLDHESLIELKKTLSRNNPFKPRQIKKEQTVSFSEKTLNQAIQLSVEQQNIPLPTLIFLNEGFATIKSSLKLGNTPFYLNTTAQLIARNEKVTLDQLSIGNLAIPGFVLYQLTPYAIRFIDSRFPESIQYREAIKDIDITGKRLSINYQWSNQLTNNLRTIGRDLIISPKESERIQTYYQRIVDITRLRFFRRTQLNEILQPLFKFAKEQSQISYNPIAENKAALIALGIAVSGVQPNYVFKEKQRKAHLFRLTLQNRGDLAQHFIISSTLSIISNKALSDAIGLSKEIDDSRGGSGFSFPDLLADKAGVRLAELAVGSKMSAKYVQDMLSNPNLTENDFMPAFDHLPEAISELQFKKDYIDITHPKYLFVEEELIRRINSCALYKNKT